MTAAFMKIAVMHATAAAMIIITGVECAGGKKSLFPDISFYACKVFTFPALLLCVRFTINTTLEMSAISRLANCRFKIFFSPCGYLWIRGKTYSTEAEF